MAKTLSQMLKIDIGREFEHNISHGENVAANLIAAQMVVGPPLCGKTSMLFEYAFNCAENGEYVLFVAPKPLMKLPLFVNDRKQPDPMVLKRINMVYLANGDELTDYFANIHLDKVRNSPIGKTRHILVDDFDCYFQEKGSRVEDTTRLAKCIAYIVDAAEFWSKRQSAEESECSVLLAETITGDGMSAEKLGLYQRWITDFIKVEKCGNSLFQIQPIQHSKNSCNPLELTLHYKIDDNEIKVINKID